MSKEEYLNQLRKYLKKLPKEDFEDAMEYFTEYFEETDEAGAQALMTELGSPKAAARDLISQLLDKKINERNLYPEEKKQKETSGSHIFWIACLAILAAPVGAPLLIALAAVLFCVLLCVAIALLCVFILAVALFLIGGKLFLRGILAIPASISGFAVVTGGGLLTIGIGLLIVVLGVYLCKWFGLLFVKLAQKISRRKKVD